MVRHYYIAAPYPDELIGSVLIRTARHRGLGNKRLAELLIGSRQTRVPLLLSLQLREISEGTSASPAELLHEHTPFRFITAFMSPEMTSRFEKSIIDGTHGSLASLCQSVTVGGRGPMYCPQCVREDLHAFGESYWHRQHNLPFVDECRIHQYPLFAIRKHHWSFSASISPHECSGEAVDRLLERGPVASWLAQQGIATLRNTFRQSVEAWSTQYRAMAEYRNFPHVGVGLCGHSFSAAILGFYGDTFFRRHGWSFSLNSRSWPSIMLRQGNSSEMVTGKHLVIQAFLLFATTPDRLKTGKPGRMSRSYDEVDNQMVARLAQRFAEELVKGRPSARTILSELGFWETYRHQRALLPHTTALVDEWYQAYRRLRKDGKAT